MAMLPSRRLLLASVLGLSVVALVAARSPAADGANPRRLLYVAEPGVRDLLEYGGHGVLVFDLDDGDRFVRPLASKGLDEAGKPLNVKGVCASAATGRLYVSTLRFLTCYDLANDAIVW